MLHANKAEGVYIEEIENPEKGFLERNTFVIAEKVNISNSSGTGHTVIQDVKDSNITIQEVNGLIKVDSNGLDRSQEETMEALADEIISRIEMKPGGEKKDELEGVKKGKRETKLELSLPFIPLKFERTRLTSLFQK